MTHEYTILTGGIVIRGDGAPDSTAIAWADDVVLALGRDADVRAISRGDSRFVGLRGAVVVPLGGDGTVRWPADATLEVGGPADLAVLDRDPRVRPGSAGEGSTGDGSTVRGTSRGGPARSSVRTLALVRGGRVVAGALPPESDLNSDPAPTPGDRVHRRRE